jgi:alpha-tubulin suppressor-like RCC1 family protein
MGGSFTMILTFDNKLYAWGVISTLLNADYAMGDGATVYRTAPKVLDMINIGVKTIKSISAGFATAALVTTDGSYYIFGDNTALIGGDILGSPLPKFIQHVNLAAYTRLQAGESITSINVAAVNAIIKTDMNRTLIVGDNSAGQVGVGGTSSYSPNPAELLIPNSKIADVAMYSGWYPGSPRLYYHTLALTDGCTYPPKPNMTAVIPVNNCNVPNAVYGFGANNLNQLGDSTSTSRYLSPNPVDMTGVLQGSTIVQVTAGGDFYVAMSSDGVLYSWGTNANGQLGDSTTSPRASPVAVSTSANSALYGRSVLLYDCGQSSCNVITTDNVIVGWGQNLYGSIGDGTALQRNLPTVCMKGFIGTKTITQIASGAYHTIVLADQYLYSWGSNSQLQLGDNSLVASRYFPVAVSLGALIGKNVTSIAAGGNFNLVLIDGMLIEELY